MAQLQAVCAVDSNADAVALHAAQSAEDMSSDFFEEMAYEIADEFPLACLFASLFLGYSHNRQANATVAQDDTQEYEKYEHVDLPDDVAQHEERVIIEQGYEDMVHRFLDESMHTVNHSPEFVPWRPDKIVMQAQEERAYNTSHAKLTWKCQNVQILGTEATPKLALSG